MSTRPISLGHEYIEMKDFTGRRQFSFDRGDDGLYSDKIEQTSNQRALIAAFDANKKVVELLNKIQRGLTTKEKTLFNETLQQHVLTEDHKAILEKILQGHIFVVEGLSEKQIAILEKMLSNQHITEKEKKFMEQIIDKSHIASVEDSIVMILDLLSYQYASSHVRDGLPFYRAIRAIKESGSHPAIVYALQNAAQDSLDRFVPFSYGDLYEERCEKGGY